MIKTKFLITGHLRSGTTFLSTLINSQDDACCFEIALNQVQDIKDEKDKINFNSNLKNLNPGLACFDIPLPIIETSSISKEKIIEHISDHFVSYYKVNNFGFKKTLINQEELLMFKKIGFKIIVLKRNIDDLFFSYIHNVYKDPFKSSLLIKDYLKSIDFYKFKKLNPSDFITVDFENLVDDDKKETTLKKIAEYLGFEINYEKPLTADFSKNLPSSFIRKWKKNSSFVGTTSLSKNYKSKKKDYKMFTDFILGKNFSLKLSFKYFAFNLVKILIKFFNYLRY
tara:strand:+ start:55 stop:903 length:849 start_codon:yes stop_codon:yes gene_type:complete